MGNLSSSFSRPSRYAPIAELLSVSRSSSIIRIFSSAAAELPAQPPKVLMSRNQPSGSSGPARNWLKISLRATVAEIGM
ncbi:hypothetical protein D3C73_1180870 [compost metagenome]